MRVIFCWMILALVLFVFSTRIDAKQYIACADGIATLWEDAYFADSYYAGVRKRQVLEGCHGTWYAEAVGNTYGHADVFPGIASTEEILKMLQQITERQWLNPPAAGKRDLEIAQRLSEMRNKGMPKIFIDPSKLPAYIAKSFLAASRK